MSKGSSIHVENERDDRATLLVDDRLPLCSTLASNSMLAPVESEDGGGWLGVEAPLIEEDGSQRRITGPQRFVDANGVPCRIPKLAVRQKTSDDEDPSETTTLTAMPYARSESGSSARSSRRLSTLHPGRSASDDTIPTRNGLSNKDNPKSVENPAKKKKRGVLGFLTLKEPSTAAWAEFAEAEKARAKGRGANTVVGGLPGGSTQKLPDFVPKVNSKWDGLPDSAKRRSMESKASSRRHRDSTFSSSTRQSDWTSRTSVSASSSNPRQSIGTSLQSPRSSRPPSAPWSAEQWERPPRRFTTQASALAMDRRALGPPIEETDENGPQTFLLPPSPDGHDKILLPDLTDAISPLTPPELDADDVRYISELRASGSPDGERIAEAPTTPPSGQGSQPVLLGIHYAELDGSASDSRNGSPDFIFHTAIDSDDEKYQPMTLADQRRRAINFSRPRAASPDIPEIPNLSTLNLDAIANRSTPLESVPLSETLSNNSGQTEPFLTDTFATHSRETGHIPQRVASTLLHDRRDGDARSTAHESEDDSSEDEADGQPFPDEPDFSTDPNKTKDRKDSDTTIGEKDRSRLARKGSQVSLVPSVAPSVMSEHWYLSPKERLGLGSKVRKSAVLPWEPDETADRPTSPIPEGKRKRLSLRPSSRR